MFGFTTIFLSSVESLLKPNFFYNLFLIFQVWGCCAEYGRNNERPRDLPSTILGAHGRLQQTGQREASDRVPVEPVRPEGRGRAPLAHQGVAHPAGGRERHPAGSLHRRRRPDPAGGAQQGPDLARGAGRPRLRQHHRQ